METHNLSNSTLPAVVRRRGIQSGSHPLGSVQLLGTVDTAVARTRRWLGAHQHEEGYWCGELEGDTILESEYILLLAWLARERTDIACNAARYILQQQQTHGGWSLFPGGELDISASVKAYFALKLTGYEPESDPLRRAREAIRTHGGADAVNSFTRFYLALLGQISYDDCPAVPPEIVLLPNWSPVNIYRISAWSRTIFVPLSIMWAHRPQRRLPAAVGIRELFLKEPQDWPPLCCPGHLTDARWFSWDHTFRLLDAGLKWCENHRLRPLRSRALRVAKNWMLDHFSQSDGLGAIFPPIIWSVVALKSLGYGDESPEVKYCHRQLDELMIADGDTIRLQPCKSPVWDTALTLRALAAGHSDPVTPDPLPPATVTSDPVTPDPVTPAQQQGVDWLLSKEVRSRGDWSVNVRVSPGGWFFEHRNALYPDVDDTIMVMMALAETTRSPTASAAATSPSDDACGRGLRWLLAMQNRDGGWGAFDRDNDLELLCHVPFADHNAMIDPSTPDMTARVLEGLAQFGYLRGKSPVDRAVHFLRRTQQTDGSWFGRWGVNYIYGTWQVLTGLAAIGTPSNDPAVQRGAQWLLDHQHVAGGWGESPDSYASTAQSCSAPTASQTAWAIMGLIAAGQRDHPSVVEGIRYLADHQKEDGVWHEPEFTGTGFPRVFYLRYHLYPIYFPLLALSRWREGFNGESRGQS